MMGPVKTMLPDPAHPLETHSEGPMTEVQAVRLRELAEDLGEPFDGNLTERQAHQRIEALQSRKDG